MPKYHAPRPLLDRAGQFTTDESGWVSTANIFWVMIALASGAVAVDVTHVH